jgi:hypothetical protein
MIAAGEYDAATAVPASLTANVIDPANIAAYITKLSFSGGFFVV